MSRPVINTMKISRVSCYEVISEATEETERESNEARSEDRDVEWEECDIIDS
jgi:hypothetical protein